MNEIQFESNRVCEIFGIEGQPTAMQRILLAPISVPMGAFWRIIDFVLCDIPDILLGVKKIPSKTPEEWAAFNQNLWDAHYEAKHQRIQEIKSDLWPS